jgi:hypothetical protein
MSSTRYVGRKLKRPSITTMNEEPGGSRETPLNNVGNRIFSQRQQQLIGSQAAYSDSNPNVAITRIYSNPASRSFSVDDGFHHSYNLPDENTLRSQNSQYAAPDLGNNFSDGISRPSLPVGLPTRHQETLNWQDHGATVDRSRNDNNTGNQPFIQTRDAELNDRGTGTEDNRCQQRNLSQYDDLPSQFIGHPSQSVGSINKMQGQPQFTNPRYESVEGRNLQRPAQQPDMPSARGYNAQPSVVGPAFDPDIYSTEEVSMSRDYNHGLAESINLLDGFVINSERDQHPVRSNTFAYFQEPSPNSSLASCNNSIGSSNSRLSTEGVLPAHYAPSHYPITRTDRPLDSADLSQHIQRPDKVCTQNASQPETMLMYLQEGSKYEKVVLLWQDQHGMYVKMKFDTQCRGSNWVSKSVVENLGVKLTRLSEQAEFRTFNDQPMIAKQQTNLSFSSDDGETTYNATFYVATDNVPFEVMLGAGDCHRLRIIRPPVLGLIAKKQNERRFYPHVHTPPSSIINSP